MMEPDVKCGASLIVVSARQRSLAAESQTRFKKSRSQLHRKKTRAAPQYRCDHLTVCERGSGKFQHHDERQALS
jgi:hypothetical protein